MRLRKGAVTHQQDRFAKLMARSGSATYAAREAGYRQPSSQGGELLRNPTVAARIRHEQTVRLQTEGAEVGLDTLITIARGEEYPASARVAAGKHLVTMAGISAAADDSDLESHQMSRAQLNAVAEEARRQLAEIEAQELTLDLQASTVGGVFD